MTENERRSASEASDKAVLTWPEGMTLPQARWVADIVSGLLDDEGEVEVLCAETGEYAVGVDYALADL